MEPWGPQAAKGSCALAHVCSWGFRNLISPHICLEEASPGLVGKSHAKLSWFLQSNLDQEGALQISSPTPC